MVDYQIKTGSFPPDLEWSVFKELLIKISIYIFKNNKSSHCNIIYLSIVFL